MEQDKKDLFAILIISGIIALANFLFSLPKGLKSDTSFSNGDAFILVFSTLCFLVFPITILKISQIYNKEALKNGN